MSVLTADQFQLHACLEEADFNVLGPSQPASYIHHFFSETPRTLYHPSLRVHVFYIPITFDVYVSLEGLVAWSLEGTLTEHNSESDFDMKRMTPAVKAASEVEAKKRLLDALECGQPFPGGFIRSERAFRHKLRAFGSMQTGIRSLLKGQVKAEDSAEPATKRLKRDSDVISNALKEASHNAAQTSENVTEAAASATQEKIRISGRVVARIAHDFENNEDVAFKSLHYWLIEANLSMNEIEGDEALQRNHRQPGCPEAKNLQTENFSRVHRRIEWFMHFYIDAMSNIHVDPRWRVFVALRYLTPFDMLDQLRMESDELKNNALRLACSQREGDKEITKLAQSITANWPRVDISVKEAFMTSLEGYKLQTLTVDHTMDALLMDNSEPAEILGLVTVYQFFALPRDRARISQFFVLPHRQRQGLGREILCALHELLCADSNIRQITVEDPAPAFQRLRDICSICISMKLGILRPECLYPNAEIEDAMRQAPSKQLEAVPWDHDPGHPEKWPEYSAAFKHILKETPIQRRRIRLLIKFARFIPSSLLQPAQTRLTSIPMPSKRHQEARRSGATSTPARLSKRKLTPGSEETNDLIEWQRDEPTIKALRIAEKQRFRLESIEWYSQKRTLGDVQNELETEWRTLFKSLCASLYVLRKIYVL